MQCCAGAVLDIPLCLSQPVLYWNGWKDWVDFWHRGFLWIILHWGNSFFSKIRVLPSGNFSRTQDLTKFRHGMLTTAGFINSQLTITAIILSIQLCAPHSVTWVRLADCVCYRYRMSLADAGDFSGFAAARLPAAVCTACRPCAHWARSW